MTISSSTSRNDYTGAGIAGPFAFGYRIFAATDLQVTRRSAAGAETTQVYPLDFTISAGGVGNRTGGSITLSAVLAAGESLTVRRVLPVTQTTDLRNLGAYLPETIEDQFDRLVMIAQQQQDQLDRAIKLKPSLDPAGRSTLLEPTVGKVVVGDGIGFTMATLDASAVALPGAGRTVATLSAYLANNAVFNPLDYGAVGDGLADDTTKVQAALDAPNVGGVGGTVLLPAGKRFRTTAPLRVYPKTTLQGAGKQTSVISIDHDGDGLQTLSAINGSTAVFVALRDFAIYTARATNTGAAYYDRGGSYLLLSNVSADGFKDNFVLDQSEVVVIQQCYNSINAANGRSNVWLVNGPDRTLGAGLGFTNNIVVKECQLNAPAGVGTNIRDDGGVAHSFLDNNYNGGAEMGRLAGVRGLRIHGGGTEGHTVRGITIDRVASLTGAAVGYCEGISIGKGLLCNDAVAYSIILTAVQGGEIEGVWFSGCTNNPIAINGECVAGVRIEGNAKRLVGAGAIVGPFLATSAPVYRERANTYRQRNMTWATSGAIAAGAQTVTPATMGLANTLEHLSVGQSLYVENTDGTNGEIVTITAVTNTTFTATFASAKGASFIILQREQPAGAVSGDRGTTAALTLVAGQDAPVQRFATALVNNIVLTLSAADAKNGDYFTIVRTGLGAFTIDVGGLKTMPAGTAAVVTVVFDGAAWRLESYSAL